MRDKLNYLRYEARWWWARWREKLVIWVSWHLPAGLVYWSAIRLMTKNYGGNPGDRTCGDALQAWEKPS